MCVVLTLNVRGLSYLGIARSISSTSPDISSHDIDYSEYVGHFTYWRKDFKYLYQINVEEWHKMQIYVYVPSEKFSM